MFVEDLGFVTEWPGLATSSSSSTGSPGTGPSSTGTYLLFIPMYSINKLGYS